MDADDDLLALKQQMGLAPAPEAEPDQVRVDAPPAEESISELTVQEQDELAQALQELEAQEQAEQARMKR